MQMQTTRPVWLKVRRHKLIVPSNQVRSKAKYRVLKLVNDSNFFLPGGSNPNCANANANSVTCASASASSNICSGSSPNCAAANSVADACYTANDSGDKANDCDWKAMEDNACEFSANTGTATCTVKAGGTNPNCHAAATNEATCLAAFDEKNSANDCEYADNACVFSANHHNFCEFVDNSCKFVEGYTPPASTATSGGGGTNEGTDEGTDEGANEESSEYPTCVNFDSCLVGINHLKSGPETITCAGATCTTTECCNSNPTCADFDLCEPLKKDAEAITCATVTCTADDCCGVAKKTEYKVKHTIAVQGIAASEFNKDQSIVASFRTAVAKTLDVPESDVTNIQAKDAVSRRQLLKHLPSRFLGEKSCR